MFNIKKILSLVLCGVMLMGVTSCGKSSDNKGKRSSGNLSIVCTIFPEYDWVRQLLGDKADDVELTYLLDNSVDLHSYQPTAEDIMKISNCDMFIYVGGESDEWVDDALDSATNKNMKVINLMEILGDSVKEEEVKEGMQKDEHDEEEHEHEEGEVEYDEHVWLSLRYAQVICTEITDALTVIDKDNANVYTDNLKTYLDELDKLDTEFETLIKGAKKNTLIFGDRFPFRYFVEDYGLDYYAAFVGCSAETEASFETVTFLANKADELKADTIYTIENSDGKIAKAIIDSTKTKDMNIRTLDSMQSISKEQIKNGETYMSIMQKNYNTLKSDFVND